MQIGSIQLLEFRNYQTLSFTPAPRLNILTGNALSMDIIKAMSLGAYEYWLKPLTRQVFEDGLRRALTGRRPDPAHRLPTR